MPWKETSTMDQRIQFIADYLSGRYSKESPLYSLRREPAHWRQVD